jgi:DNA-binding MarR family transcriptional regulator
VVYSNVMRYRTKQRSRSAPDVRLESSLRRIQESSRRYGKVDALTAETYLNFIYTYNRIVSSLDKITRKYGITRACINVLTILRASGPNGCNQQTLSRLLLVSRANVSGVVERLIRKGFMHRAPDERDRRACVVKISSKGEQLLDSILPQYHSRIAKLYSGLNTAEKKRCNQSMEKLRACLDT